MSTPRDTLIGALQVAQSIQNANHQSLSFQELADLIIVKLREDGLSIVGGEEDPLPVRKQATIEIHAIFEGFLGEGFTRSEALEMTKLVVRPQAMGG